MTLPGCVAAQPGAGMPRWCALVRHGPAARYPPIPAPTEAAMPGENSLSSVEHIVVLMLENRSFDHMLGYLYSDSGNVSPAGQPFEGLASCSAATPAPRALRCGRRMTASSRTSRTRSDGRPARGGRSCPAPQPRTSWAASRVRRRAHADHPAHGRRAGRGDRAGRGRAGPGGGRGSRRISRRSTPSWYPVSSRPVCPPRPGWPARHRRPPPHCPATSAPTPGLSGPPWRRPPSGWRVRRRSAARRPAAGAGTASPACASAPGPRARWR
jgi:Phosphoesterase family